MPWKRDVLSTMTKFAISSCFFLLSVYGCSVVKSDGRGGGSDDDDDETVGTLEANPLAAAYPEGLSMSSFSNDTDEATTTGALSIDDADAALNLGELNLTFPGDVACTPGGGGGCACSYKDKRALMGTFQPIADVPDFTNPPPSERLADERERLIANDDAQCFSKDLVDTMGLLVHTINNGGALETVICYEFDWGLEIGTQADTSDAEISGADACIVAFTRSEIAGAQAYIDFAKKVTEALICQGKKDDIAATGTTAAMAEEEVRKLAKSLNDARPKEGKSVSFSKANLTRLKDEDGNQVFRSDLTLTRHDDRIDEDVEYEVHMVHSPQDDTNSSYKGTIWLLHNFPESVSNSPISVNMAVSVAYAADYDDDTKLRRNKFEMRYGKFRNDLSPFTSTGIVDFNVGANAAGTFPSGGTVDSVRMMKHIVYDGYPSEGVMNFSYWRNPGSTYTENARGFIFNVIRDKNDIIRGCAVAGASKNGVVGDGVSIRKALKEGLTIEPKGWLRPFRCTQQNGPQVWRQCFYQDKNGQYKIDTAQHSADFEFIDNAAAKITAMVVPDWSAFADHEVGGDVAE